MSVWALATTLLVTGGTWGYRGPSQHQWFSSRDVQGCSCSSASHSLVFPNDNKQQGSLQRCIFYSASSPKHRTKLPFPPTMPSIQIESKLWSNTLRTISFLRAAESMSILSLAIKAHLHQELRMLFPCLFVSKKVFLVLYWAAKWWNLSHTFLAFPENPTCDFQLRRLKSPSKQALCAAHTSS